MLKIQDLDKQYGAQILFEGASLQMTPGERLGLVGRNGHGKSTLFRIILGEEVADSGIITTPRGYRIGHLAQHLHFSKPTILEEGCLGLSVDEEHDHYKVERILFGLGFTEEDMARAPAEFSGGFQVRLNLAKALVSRPNLLLLDEPTNYLDIVSVRWIVTFLWEWENELIIISHDRDFMDSVTTHTAVIHRRKIRKVEGDTGKLYAQIALEEEIHEKTRANEEKRRKQVETFVNRFRAQATKASAVQSRIKMLEKMPTRDRLAKIADLDFKFHNAPFEAKTMLEAHGVSFHYDPKVPLIRKLNLTIHAHDRIAIIGKNGKGKSTLLNVLAGERAPTAGQIKTHPNLKLGYFGQTNIDRLSPKMTVEEEIGSANLQLGRTAARTLCGIMMFSGDQAEKNVSVLSGGEKSRVMLGKILAAPANLLFLDEPTNHLDMQSIEALVDAIQEFDGAVMIVTHSEMILREVATKLVVFQNGKVDLFPGGYDEFLDKVGWMDGAEATPEMADLEEQKAPTPPSLGKKESRQQRAQVVNERSKILTPLKKEIETLEAEICRLEEVLKKATHELLEASQKKNIEAFVTLSKTIKEAQKSIDKDFELLEKATKKHDEQDRKFEEI